MTAGGDAQPPQERRRLVAVLVDTGVLAGIGAVVLAVFLSGCRGSSGGPGRATSSRSAMPSTGSTYRVTATVPVAKGPSEIATAGPMVVDPGTHTVYVVMTTGNSVSVIDGSTRTVTATVPVGKDPSWMVVDPGSHTVYVMNVGDGTVSVIDASTRTVTAIVPVGKNPDGVAVDPGNHTVYVTNGGVDNSVSVIDGSTHTVTATVPVVKNPDGVAVDPGTHTVYVTNIGATGPAWQVAGDGTVSVIDASTHAVTATVPVGEHPDEVVVDPGTHTVYVANTGALGPDGQEVGNGTVSVIDGSTRTVSATVPVGKRPGSMMVDPGSHTVYVTNNLDSTVSVIDGSTHTVTATVPVDTNPEAAAVDPGTHTVYVTSTRAADPAGNIEHGTVSVIDASTRTVTATVPVGYHPDRVYRSNTAACDSHGSRNADNQAVRTDVARRNSVSSSPCCPHQARTSTTVLKLTAQIGPVAVRARLPKNPVGGVSKRQRISTPS